MKKFNLFKEIITVNKSAFVQAINSSKVYGINIKGEIVYEPFKENEILIYEGKHTPQVTSSLMPNKPLLLSEILGKNYQLVEDDERLLIKAFSNWQALIKINTPRASYDDTTGDGVDEFADEGLESIGWQATEFNITYRMFVELLEEKCDGTLLCIEQEEPYQFSGLGYLDDYKQAYDLLFNYCQTYINNVLKDYTAKDRELLSDDELEAMKFFQCQ
ncbi:MAG: hypothetical protein QM497_04520 [Sulfurimonas sp.]